jgi:NADPH:quinone reductase-like Zn-dependent oxidoreductase
MAVAIFMAEGEETTMATTMKAVVHDRYGSPGVLRVAEVETPVPADDEVLVRVHAAALNRLDWYGMAGRPWIGRVATGLRAPKDGSVGVDFAGTVAAVGRDVTGFAAGDEVFGARSGALAEYVRVRADGAVARRPAGVAVEEAATVGVAALTALQGLRDKGGLQPGQKVLVHGAGGGVGTFAVQIAKALGAEVTAVCGPQNVELVRSLGADEVVDYTRDDFSRSSRRFDLIFDNAGTRSWRACARVLAPDGIVVLVGGPMTNPLLGPLGHIVRMLVRAKAARRRCVFFVTKTNRADLELVGELLESGRVRPAIDRTYTLDECAEAFRYLGTGHLRGKLVVTLGP